MRLQIFTFIKPYMNPENNIVKNYSVKETPWYFGAYLNMARHNVYLLINHLTDKFSYLKNYKKLSLEKQTGTSKFELRPQPFSILTDDEQIVNENILTKIFDTSYPQYDNDRFRIYKYMVRKHSLPFIKNFSETGGRNLDDNPIIDYDGLHQYINEAFALLVRLRDSFSHYLAIDKFGNKIEDRNLTVSTNIHTQVINLYTNSPNYSLERFSATQSDFDYEHLSLYKIFEADNITFTEQGLYFFINLFLERGYGIKFLKKIRGFKNDTNPAFRATIKTFTTYALKVPDERLDNDDPRMSLLMDVLNELKRCPAILSKHLSDQDQKKFNPQLNDDSKANVLLNSVNYDDIDDEQIDYLLNSITTFKRHQDRFPYFALRCIDELNLLPNIRFQVALGSIERRSYDKVVGDVIIDRRILKKLNAFGKLSYFEGKEEQVLLELNRKVKDQDLLFDQFNPHYNINNNKIGFYTFSSGKEKIQWPTIADFPKEGNLHQKRDNSIPKSFLSIHELPKLLLLALKDPELAEKTITDFLDVNKNLVLNKAALGQIRDKIKLCPSIFNRRRVEEKALKQKGRIQFLNHAQIKNLRQRNKITDERLADLKFMDSMISNTKNIKIKEYLKQINYNQVLETRKDALRQVLPAGLKVNQLPTIVIDYLLGMVGQDPHKKILARFKEIKTDTNKRLKQLDRDDDSRLKVGEIATFLTKDIINLVISEDLKKKITSAYYGRIQYQFANFSISKGELTTIIEQLGLFDNIKGHPFLASSMLNKVKGIREFYDNYLSAKLKWINGIIANKNLKDLLKNNKISLPFKIKSIISKSEAKNLDNWLKSKKDMPVDLPVSIFDDQLNTYLKKELQHVNIAFQETDKFSVLLTKLLNGDKQPFYNHTRWYRSEEGDVPFSPDGHSSLTIKNNYSSYAELTEKKIRHVQTQDRVLRLACQSILGQLSDVDDTLTFYLQDILAFTNTNPLNRPATFKHKLKEISSEGVYVVAEDTLSQKEEVVKYLVLEQEEEQNLYDGQKGFQWTIKDFGRFRRFMHDRRLPAIFNYLETSISSYDLLSYQISEYDRYREAIFRETFELEAYLANTYFDEVVVLKLQDKAIFPQVQFKTYLELIKQRNMLDKAACEFINSIRNKFSHSEFPDYYPEISKITVDDIDDFELNKSKKGFKEYAGLSISKKVFDLYQSIMVSCK